MFKFDESMIGRKVRFVNTKLHEEMPEYYPKVGTIGTIIPSTWDYFNVKFLVDWPEYSTKKLEKCEKMVDKGRKM